jgi:hypothetical protein
MPFSTANLAVVAYAIVSADGSSDEINSGVATTRLQPGFYHVILPGGEDMTDTEPLQQGQGDPRTKYRKDLILVTLIVTSPGAVYPVAAKDIDEFTKQIVIGSGEADSDFAVTILRPTIPTPTDSRGSQNGPV